MNDLATWRTKLAALEPTLEEAGLATLGRYETPHGALDVVLSQRFVRACKRGRVWRSAALLTALKNVSYGLDPVHERSRGGADGVFRVDRTFTPRNEMMRKLFDRFLDRDDETLRAIEAAIGVTRAELVAVRVVSHHMRVLGVVARGRETSTLFVVDYDDTE